MVLAVLVASTAAVPRYMSSYGNSVQGRVLHAQNLDYTLTPSLGYPRPSNMEYAPDDATNLDYTHPPHVGYSHGSERHRYETTDNYVSKKKLYYLVSDTKRAILKTYFRGQL